MSKLSDRGWYLLSIAGAVLIATTWIAVAAAQCGGFGFPLDDGWIHQTYARNLAMTGRLTYASGQISTGSTAPLWTALLSVGYLLGVSPIAWALTLGLAFWLLTAWTSVSFARRLFPDRPGLARWIGLFCLAEWHLAWAALSGMEITLFAFLCLLLLDRYAGESHPLLLGLVGGLLSMVRPEGIVLIVLIAATALFDRQGPLRRVGARWEGRWLAWLADVAAGLAVSLVPYVVFNVVASGQPLPNTFYAKQAEYRELLARPIWMRLWTVVRRPLVGAQVVLIPGALWLVARAVVSPVRQRDGQSTPSALMVLLPAAWCVTYLTMYALLLPVDYQYGRYVMPIIPFLVIYGLGGTGSWLKPRGSHMLERVISRAVPLAIVCLLLGFLIVGGRAYAQDVGFIQGEMVDVALWLSNNTPPEAVIAAHDIGAIGYFADRPLLDLAGLVTPEVVPFMRDEGLLLDWAVEQGAGYVVTFPSWYPELVRDDRLLLRYQTTCSITRERGRDNMAVYEIVR